MGKWDGLDRRRFPRVVYPCLVVIRNSQEEKDVILTHTENVGIGGVCVILKKNVKIFTPVELELDLLDLGQHIKCKGRVVWNIQRKGEEKKKPLFYDLGIEFDNLDKKEHERLQEIVSRLAQDEANLA